MAVIRPSADPGPQGSKDRRLDTPRGAVGVHGDYDTEFCDSHISSLLRSPHFQLASRDRTDAPKHSRDRGENESPDQKLPGRVELLHSFSKHVDSIETFQNEDGSRVTSRWVLTGTNNGILGTEPDQQPIAMTGTAVWEVRGDGKLLRNWVEQASFETYQRLLAK